MYSFVKIYKVSSSKVFHAGQQYLALNHTFAPMDIKLKVLTHPLLVENCCIAGEHQDVDTRGTSVLCRS